MPAGDDCAFHRTAEDALLAGFSSTATVFDGAGHRLEASGAQLSIARTEPDGADDLARILRNWLGDLDALRESTANWSLALLIRASVEHRGYSRR